MHVRSFVLILLRSCVSYLFSDRRTVGWLEEQFEGKTGTWDNAVVFDCRESYTAIPISVRGLTVLLVLFGLLFRNTKGSLLFYRPFCTVVNLEHYETLI